MREFLLFLPDEAMPLVLVLLAFGIMLGVARPRTLGGFLLFLILSPVLAGVFGELLDTLPGWMTLLVILAVLGSVARSFFRLLIGRTATDEMVGNLAADVVRGCFKGVFMLLLVPFRVLSWLMRRSAMIVLCVGLVGTPGVVGTASAGPVTKAVSKKVIRSAVGRRTLAPAAKNRAIRLFDIKRDNQTLARTLERPRTVFRYTSLTQANAAKRAGIRGPRHFTATAGRGRPLTAARAQARYGLSRRPAARITVRLPAGTKVKPNKVVGGAKGQGELLVPRSIQRQEVRSVVRLRAGGPGH